MQTHLNIKRIVSTFLLVLITTWAWANNVKSVYTFDVQRTISQTTASECKAKGSMIIAKLNCADATMNDALNNKSIKIYTVNPNSGKYTLGSTTCYFNTKGLAVSSANVGKAFISKYDGSSAFSVNTYAKIEDGNSYTFKEAFVHESTKDTIEIVFNVTIGNKQSVTTDLPEFNHRADLMDSWLALPYVQVNDEEPEYVNCVQGNVGDKITIGMRPRNEDESCTFNISNSQGETVKYTNSKYYVIPSATLQDAGTYSITVIYKFADGTKRTQKAKIFVDVQENQGQNYDWNEKAPRWSYDFRDEYPDGFPQPTKTHRFTQHNGKAANQLDGEWWTVYWGDNLNADCGSGEVLQNAMKNMMAKYDKDFAYIRDEMGWPPDINARNGYKSFVYVFGSGLNRDNKSNTEEGGYQGFVSPDDGGGWPCVWASYYPVSRFRDDADRIWSDGDYQREAMIHEGIHAVFADMDGVKKSSWFHEAGNVWLQMAMNAKRDGTYGAPGWLGVGNLICPFMPIECYSGWLQDGSFGGPAAEGVNMYNSSGQKICTWRNLIGGVQYGEIFPIFIGEAVGQGAVPWIWRYCKDWVLKGIAQGNSSEGVSGIGDEAMRLFIMQYRAKLATLDFGNFSSGCRNLLNGSFGTVVKAEYEPYWIDVAPFSLTPYQVLTQNDAEGWFAPDTLTNPGWSGGNILPIHVDLQNNGCEIFFRPEDDNMMCQLCYRTKTGDTYYSQPVTCGKMVLKWNGRTQPANGVVFVVPCNTDYIFTGEEQRKKHWDYRIKLGDGALAPASTKIKWYFYEQTLVDQDFETGIDDVIADDNKKETNPEIKIISGMIKAGHQIQLDLNGINPNDVVAHLVGVSGVVIDEQKVSDDGKIQLPGNINKGMYILALYHNGKVNTFKVYVE